MNVQVNFTTDPELKKAALMRAKKEGMTMKTVFNMFLKSYSMGDISFRLDVARDDIFTEEDAKDYSKALEDLKNGDVMTGEQLFKELGI